MDYDKPAVFLFIYLINKKTFSIKKEVKYDGHKSFLKETNTVGRDKVS
jgi:hypothetical protein